MIDKIIGCDTIPPGGQGTEGILGPVVLALSLLSFVVATVGLALLVEPFVSWYYQWAWWSELAAVGDTGAGGRREGVPEERSRGTCRRSSARRCVGCVAESPGPAVPVVPGMPRSRNTSRAKGDSFLCEGHGCIAAPFAFSSPSS